AAVRATVAFAGRGLRRYAAGLVAAGRAADAGTGHAGATRGRAVRWRRPGLRCLQRGGPRRVCRSAARVATATGEASGRDDRRARRRWASERLGRPGATRTRGHSGRPVSDAAGWCRADGAHALVADPGQSRLPGRRSPDVSDWI